tara:strand:- start:970 stop:1515 length:546 start_codon:yes stop_codon:yes gene_type:complete
MALTRLGLNQAVNLATNTTGTLAVANGGTGLSSGFINGTTNVGKVLQVEYFFTHANISSSSTSDAATIVTDQITPSATNSKILIWVDGGRGTYGPSGCEGTSKLYRQIGGGGFSELQVCHASQVVENGGYGKPSIAFNYVDTSHNTTSAIDYKIYIKTNTNTYHLNSGGAQIAMMLMEMAA